MRTALITGATDGLGRHMARDLASEGWTVLVHGRSAERAADVVPGARVFLADLSSLATKMVLESRGSSLSTVEEGAEATERLIVSDVWTGLYFNGQREARADPQAYDAQARERLWELSERLVA